MKKISFLKKKTTTINVALKCAVDIIIPVLLFCADCDLLNDYSPSDKLVPFSTRSFKILFYVGTCFYKIYDV